MVTYTEVCSKLASQNPMFVSGRNWCDCVNLSQEISMIGMNVRHMYSEWYDTVADEEIDNVPMVCIFKRK